MAELLAELPDCDASDRVLTAIDLSELEPPSKKKKTGKFSSENESGVDDGWFNVDRCMLDDPGVFDRLLDEMEALFDEMEALFASENEGGVDDSRSNDDGCMFRFSKLYSWLDDDSHELRQLALFPMELEPPLSGKSSSEDEGRLDDRRSSGDIWMTNKAGLLSPPPSHSLSLDLCLGTQAGLLSPPPPHSLSLDLRSGIYDSQVSIQYWNELENHDNHVNHVSSENEDGLLNCRSDDDLPWKLTLPVSCTEIGKESNALNDVEGSCEVHPVAGKCPVRHPKAVQLLSASSSNSDCLDVNLRMEGRHPSPLELWLRDRLSGSIHLPNVGIIFGNLKPENVLMTDRSFHAQLSCIKKNNMDPFLVKYTREAEDLFLRLREKNPELRLEAREVILHPFSWRSNVKLHFLQKMSLRLNEKNPGPDPALLTELQSNKPLVFDGNWIDKLDPIFKTYILQRILQKKDKKLDFTSVVDLVRLMRNKSAHLNEFPDEIKELVGPGEEGFYTYFDLQFPELFMKVYGAAFQFCREEEWFEVFLKENFPEYFRSDAL